MTNHSDSLYLEKKPMRSGGMPKPVSIAMSIVGVLLMSYAISDLAAPGGWPEALQISAWFALPIATVFWLLKAVDKPLPRLRCPERLASVQPRPHFFKHLRRERLRADRSGTPLSLCLFAFDETPGRDIPAPRPEHFLERLCAGIRETDIVGHVGDGRIGLLLTDTDGRGREAYLNRLAGGEERLPFSMIGGTYPDQVFDEFMAHNRDAAEACLILPDAAANQAGFGYPLKRAIDLVGAIVAIVLFSPLLLLATVAIKLTSPGPVIFRQTRLGRNAVPFVFYKFRSMTWNADDRIHRDYVASLIAGSVPPTERGEVERPIYKIKSDPRVTRIGRILRKTSIDELPQLFNVLKGDMSLVGPRPPLPYEAEKYQPWHFWRIFEAKPGITGLWQVEGRSRTSFDDMVRLDLEYARHCSLWLDLKLLLKTVKVVVLGIGAA